MWEGFDEFCRREGIEQGMVRKLFKQEPEALADLRLLETAEIEPAELERRFGPRLEELFTLTLSVQEGGGA
jgi:hypothetical protein